ncbi:serine hydrolase FSH [Annulohypoxylon truncatum]|uniref:serine hydrolase FSH n=1 Tax=Annulohypoxylon truncatum TaxID=327061 RepID=UPI002007531D|nr:serine hydrolase FSH [Annulohypoxylon truncatum]KAI1205340.1 serine hydrolase FSH [Annulohypoxylon truncatum]
MRFLCLHGSGTNSKLSYWLSAAIRYELGDHHTYEFVEGTLPSPVAPELNGMAAPDDEFFSYIDLDDLNTCVSSLVNLDTYISEEGPFDGIMAFSQGAMIAATYIIWKMTQNAVLQQDSPTFKCAIFFSAWGAYDPELLWQSQLRPMTPLLDGEAIHIPTAHIWGQDDVSSAKAASLSGICSLRTRQIYVHPGGHEIPGARMNAAVKSSVRIIRRIISLADELAYRDRK